MVGVGEREKTKFSRLHRITISIKFYREVIKQRLQSRNNISKSKYDAEKISKKLLPMASMIGLGNSTRFESSIGLSRHRIPDVARILNWVG